MSGETIGSQVFLLEGDFQHALHLTATPAPAPPANNSLPTTSTNQPPDSQSNSSQTQTSPPNTTTPTTTETSTSQAITQAPPPAQCDYTVTPIKFGFQINITSSTDGTYTINIGEEGQTGRTTPHHHSNESSSLTIQHLKPCTEYEHSVTFMDNGNKTSCNRTVVKAITSEINSSDIEEVKSCSLGYVCYRSDWDISSLSNFTPAESCMSDSKTFCMKLKEEDFCSNLTVNFTLGNCPSFSLTQSIGVDFLNPSEIRPRIQNKLPVEIELLPPNCNVTVDYTCLEYGNTIRSKTLSELEPFTQYSCIGHIEDNGTTIITNAFDVKINCNVLIPVEYTEVTNTSVVLSWTTSSNNCPHLPGLPKFSYNCGCPPTGHKSVGGQVEKHSGGGKCDIRGLTPYTEYTCGVQPTYNGTKVKEPSETKATRTKAGKPDKTQKVTLSLPDNNVIKVSCRSVSETSFRGPKQIYIARLHYGGDPETEIKKDAKEKKCEFEFKDLNYSTAYKVKVITFNGELHSEPAIEEVSTEYNSRALIGVLVFLLVIIISVTLAVAAHMIVKSRKSRSDVTQDVMLNAAIYMNVPTRG